MINELSPKAAELALAQGALLVDVREPYEVAEFACDVTETIVLPLSEFNNRFQELPRDRQLILVCAGGGRSLYAANLLASQGYTNIANLDGGVFTWHAQGLPVKRSGRTGDEQSVNQCNLWAH